MGQFQRRQFLLAAGTLLGAQLAGAQVRSPDRPRIVGYLDPGVNPKLTLEQDPALQRFRKLGWIEGQNVVTERRYAESKLERLRELTQELIRANTEVFLTNGSAATVTVARATSTIPIVFFNVPFPVELKLVDSFGRPGRNVTGASSYVVGMAAKRFEFLRDIAPAAKRVYLMSAPEFSETVGGAQANLGPPLGKSLGFEVKTGFVRESKDIESALAEARSWGAQALFISANPIISAARHRIVEFALQHRLPSFSTGGIVEAGGLLSYGLSDEEFWAQVIRCAEYIDRVLRGARPSELAVVQPRNYQLVINAKTAKALGLTIPRSLLLRADRVIE